MTHNKYDAGRSTVICESSIVRSIYFWRNSFYLVFLLCRLPCVMSPPFTMRSFVSVTTPVTASVWATVIVPSTAVADPDAARLTAPPPIVTSAVVVARI